MPATADPIRLRPSHEPLCQTDVGQPRSNGDHVPGHQLENHALRSYWVLVACFLFALILSSRSLSADDSPAASPSPPPSDRQTLIVVLGAAGEEQYGELFQQWAGRWLDHARDGQITAASVGLEPPGEKTDLQQLQTLIEAQNMVATEPLWIVLIGHGTYDGRHARFNLRGADLTEQQLAQWLAPFQRPLIIVNCAAASSPFLSALAGENRVVISSTKSGHQYNFARFGDFLSQIIGDPQADLDKDGQTSLLEAYLSASSQVEEFYRQEARLATEHALLDDNGDGRGTPADWFRGVRAVKKPKDDVPVDGLRAHQFHLIRSEVEQQLDAERRARRDALETQLATLRESKSQLGDDAYYQQLLPIMVELARLYESAAGDPSS